MPKDAPDIPVKDAHVSSFGISDRKWALPPKMLAGAPLAEVRAFRAGKVEASCRGELAFRYAHAPRARMRMPGRRLFHLPHFFGRAQHRRRRRFSRAAFSRLSQKHPMSFRPWAAGTRAPTGRA